MIEILRRLWKRVWKRRSKLFVIPAGRQRTFLESLPEAKDDIERSYNQYCCQMFLEGTMMSAFLNLLALPLIVWYYMGSHNDVSPEGSFDAIAVLDGKPGNIIPDVLRQEFHNLYEIKAYINSVYMGEEERNYFWQVVKRHPVSYLFLLKCLIKICNYGYIIKVYNPKAIVVCNEYSFTSSILTELCELHGIMHINVMHGEKLYNIRDSFFRYSKCYVWSEHYVQLFCQLRACKNQFVIALPPSMVFDALKLGKKFDYTYYLGDENDMTIKHIMNCLKILVEQGYRVAIRPHPRYTDIESVEMNNAMVVIENCENTSIDESVLRTRNVISLYSTVLTQAYHNNVNVVIDDVSRPTVYGKLHELQYVVLKYEHQLLSSLIYKQ